MGLRRGEVGGHSRALVEVASNRETGSRRAAAIGLLKPAIAAIEARHHPVPPLAGRRLGIDQGLHLVPPGLSSVGPADPPHILQPPANLAEPLQVGPIGRWSPLPPPPHPPGPPTPPHAVPLP